MQLCSSFIFDCCLNEFYFIVLITNKKSRAGQNMNFYYGTELLNVFNFNSTVKMQRGLEINLGSSSGLVLV